MEFKYFLEIQSLDEYIAWNKEVRQDVDQKRIASMLASSESIDSDGKEFKKVILCAENFESLLNLCINNLSQESELKLEERSLNKWVTTQGGTASSDTILPKLHEYATPREVDKTMQIKIVDKFVDDFDLIVPDPIISSSRELYNSFDPQRASSGGITYYGDKRDLVNRVKSIKAAITRPYHVDVISVWYRDKDGKVRLIFVDTLANYFRAARVSNRIFEKWHSLPFDHRYTDRQLSEIILSLHAACAYGGDCDGMDYHLPITTVGRVLSRFTTDSKAREQISRFYSSLAHAPVHWGGYVISAIWDMLSGLYPTHDAESIIMCAISNWIAACLGFIIVKEPRRLARNECFVIHCGDDFIILFGSVVPLNVLDDLYEEVLSYFGLVLSRAKSSYATRKGWIEFCKKYWPITKGTAGFKYYPDSTVHIPKYSLTKAVNGIFRPEKFKPLMDDADLIAFTCSKLDNCVGMTNYVGVVRAIMDMNPMLFLTDRLIVDDSWVPSLDIWDDWWHQNQNSGWSLLTSPTYKEMVKYYVAILKRENALD